jgi:UDP-N-acetylglucosamine 2-epimerase (non-hydrolysing)
MILHRHKPKIKIISVVGARPNFMKMSPLVKAFKERAEQCVHTLVHTGQHYDHIMSDIFFEQLQMARPDINLNVAPGSHAKQTAEIMTRFEEVFLEQQPDWVIVPGDVNSSLACALVASKLGIKVAHLEAGLRSYDRSMPEEINRVLIDHIADLHLIPSLDAKENLLSEGISENSIKFVGNAMIDSLIPQLDDAKKAALHWLAEKNIDRPFVLVTLHRPGNVDNHEAILEISDALGILSDGMPVIFPVHPRANRSITDLMGPMDLPNLHLVDPLGYIDFLGLQSLAAAVLTDSGGVQEETTFLDVPCITVRPNTERPITLTEGTNTLVACDTEQIVRTVHKRLAEKGQNDHKVPEKWDGKTGERVADVFLEIVL